jgi:pimeloyl-ACP methyl ester carboxylesterase
MNKPLKKAMITGALLAVPALINNAIFSRAKALGNTIGGEGRFWPWREGDIFYARDGSGSHPIVFVGGIYAGASVFEWRKNFGALAKSHEVIAFDWLGFGLSDKPNIRYSETLYIELLTDFLREVVGKPCTVVASSLGAAYAIEAAAALPEIVESLVLVCPTGYRNLTSPDNSSIQEGLYRTLTAPIIGPSLYNFMTSRANLWRYLCDEVYFDPSYVTEEVVDHYSTASHQYGAQYAPLAFIAGELGHSVNEAMPKLTQEKIRIVWGREAHQSPLADAEPFLSSNPRAELTVLDKAGLLPQDEQAEAFNRLVSDSLPPKSASPANTAMNGHSEQSHVNETHSRDAPKTRSRKKAVDESDQ